MLSYADLDNDQRDCIDFIITGDDALICADVGTGKTVISLTAADTAIRSKKVTRWLVLAPLLVCTDVWTDEHENWGHLKHLKVGVACGDKAQRIKVLESDADIVVMNYENLKWLMEHYPRPRNGKPDAMPFNGLICDEIDKLKSVSSDRFKAFRHRVKHFNMRIGLTGTLLPNDLTEIWGQMYLVDNGKAFGRSFYAWRKTNFFPTDFQQRNWSPFHDTREKLYDKLAGIAYRLKAKNLPEVVMMEPDILHLPEAVRKDYDVLERKFYLKLDRDGQTHEIDAANTAVLGGKLQQICAGFSYVGEKKDKQTIWHSKKRFDWLAEIHYEVCLRDRAQLMVFYHFQAELDELKSRYPGLRHFGKGQGKGRQRATIKLWNAGEIDMIALHPASAGHGLNLQKSGAHNIAFLTLPWSGGMFKQVTGRLARRGNTANEIFIHTALFDDTIDMDVLDVLDFKLDELETFLDALTSRT